MKILKCFYSEKRAERYEFYEDDKIISILEVLDAYEYVYTDPAKYLNEIRKFMKQSGETYLEERIYNEKLSEKCFFKNGVSHCEFGPAIILYHTDGTIKGYTHFWEGTQQSIPIRLQTMEQRTIFMQNIHML